MADVLDFKEIYKRRLEKESQVLEGGLDALNPAAASYLKDSIAVSKIAKEAATDFKNYGDLLVEEQRNALEKERVKAEKTSNIIKIALGLGTIVTNIVLFFVSEHNDKENTKMLSGFEDEHAFLKLTDKTAVQDIVRKDRKPLLSIFNK